MRLYQNEVLMQLFVEGPTWDGNLISKSDRDELDSLGLIDRFDGWQWLNGNGIQAALDMGKRIAKDWADQRFYKKATNQ